MIYSDILSNIKTSENSRELLSEIDLLLEGLFKTQDGFEAKLNSISAINSEKLRIAFIKNNISSNKEMIKEYLNLLKVELQKLKTLKLSLAFDASEHTIDNLFVWVIQNLGSGIILDIKKDKTILAGAIIEYEGKYEDLSLRKRLEEVFVTKRDQILKP